MIGKTNAGGGSGGSGLSLRVLGGTTQPTSPREGTIWVNTSVEKPDYIISGSQPESPVSGLVWIKLGSAGVSLPVDKKGTLAIPLAGCAVWNGSAWDNVDAWVYAGGKWVQFSQHILIVYAAGKLADGFTILQPMQNNSTPSSPVYTNFTMESDCIAAMNIGELWGIVFNPAVDVTNFKTLEIEFDTNQGGVCWTAMGISANNKWVEGGAQMDVRHYTESIVSKTKISLDISSVAGNKYIKIYGYSEHRFNVRVYQVILK